MIKNIRFRKLIVSSGADIETEGLSHRLKGDFGRLIDIHLEIMKVMKEQTDFDDIMSCQPRIALERISQKEVQGNRLIYNLFLRGEPTVSCAQIFEH